ncbi:sensor histidine kinase [Streptosporangium saharense]|uniref:sensor histidine kinase n=1 Tax=Streptosporangium saharense TaxID=1706840 RepID=UPI00332025F8
MWRVDLPAWRVVFGLLVLAVVCLSLAAARLARERRLLLLSLAAERTRLAGQREALGRAAAMRERARIAGELHDVVAHGVSMMTLGVGAGRMIMEKDPGRARETLRVAEESGRQALVELQRILSLLSVEGAPVATRHPQPRLSDLCDLLTQIRTAGLRVEVVEDGPPMEIGLTLELAAYRIVQEALGNTLKHAGANSAHVTLRWRPGFLDVLVRDDGRAVPVPVGAVTGTGLLGMRERATMFGGTLDARPLPGGGFEVRARLPTTGEPRPGTRLPT